MMPDNPNTDAQPELLSTAPSITLEQVSFSYPGAQIFHSLNFFITGGQWTCLIGPSGCGKSTLLRLISGTLRGRISGEIRFDGGHGRQGRTAWMAQKDLLLPWLNVADNVCLGARLRNEMSDQIQKRAISLLKDAGLGDYIHALPSALSGGMRQRVALLRTLMEERSIILMDEPFSALDALTRLKLQDLAAQLVGGATVVMVTHDPLEALRLGHRVYVMTGRPARLSDPLVPPGKPPRMPGDPAVISMQAELIDRLESREIS
jgi:putative hydroxymethylpyrimidine transport system ATP-binding protein